MVAKPKRKSTAEDVEETIREMHAKGFDIMDIAMKTGASCLVVQGVVGGVVDVAEAKQIDRAGKPRRRCRLCSVIIAEDEREAHVDSCAGLTRSQRWKLKRSLRRRDVSYSHIGQDLLA